MEKIYVTELGRTIGTMTLFDMVPSFTLLRVCFPEAKRITHDVRHDHWFVELGDTPAPMVAD